MHKLLQFNHFVASLKQLGIVRDNNHYMIFFLLLQNINER